MFADLKGMNLAMMTVIFGALRNASNGICRRRRVACNGSSF